MRKVARHWIRNRVSALGRHLDKLGPTVFILVMTVLSLVIVLPFAPIFYALDSIEGTVGRPSLEEESLAYQFVAGVLVGPLLETLLFQVAPVRLLKKFSGFKPATIVVASAILFAADHHYSISYALYAFLIGMLLAYAYWLYLQKGGPAFWVVAAIHSLRNLVTLVFINFVSV